VDKCKVSQKINKKDIFKEDILLINRLWIKLILYNKKKELEGWGEVRWGEVRWGFHVFVTTNIFNIRKKNKKNIIYIFFYFLLFIRWIIMIY